MEKGAISKLYIQKTCLTSDKSPERAIQKASEVLKKVNLEPVTFGPKEAIAILK
jgi:hypothetical protein